MTAAVCIQCGNLKREPAAKCSACNFRPQSDVERAKSLILSTGYEIDGEFRGKTDAELKNIANEIANGQPYAFVDSEIMSVVEHARRVLDVSARRMIVDGIRWLLPPILALLIIYALLILKK